MNIMNKATLKAALVAVVAGGSLAESASAAQGIHADFADLNPQQAKRLGSQYKHHVENPEVVVPALAHTDVLVLTKAVKAGNTDVYVKAAAKATARMIKHYVETELLAADGPFIVGATVLNTADPARAAAAGAAIVAGQPFDGDAARFPANAIPVDHTRDHFITAFNHLMDHVTTAKLNAHGAPLALPARLTADDVAGFRDDVRGKLKAEIRAWMDALINPDGPFVVPAIPNVAGGVARIVGGAGMPHAASVSRNHFTAAFQGLVDLVENY